MDKRLLLLGSLCAVTTQATQAADQTRPNIIVILADDLGYNDVGFTGETPIQTPNLNKLAESGVIFTNGHCNHPFSGPSRAALMSGRYQQRFGFETNPAYDPDNPYMGISTDEKLFPARLQEVGYTTGIIGKWHLGATELHNPMNRGFDYFYGFLGGGHDYFSINKSKRVWEAYEQELIRNTKPATFDGYITTAFSEDAVRFVEDNKDNPFFLYLAYNAPHTPLQAPKEDIERYSHIEDKRKRTYAAMVDVMDRGIGTVVDALKRNGLYENTIIFFTSDNGGPQEKANSKLSSFTDNTPYRAGKGSTYEGGHHVPYILCWPAKVKGGIEYNYPVNALDISRTAVALAGADAESAPAMEGVNLIPFVTGEEKGAPHEAIFWRSGSVWAVLGSDGTKQVLGKGNGKPEQYYLPDDLGEENDIINRSKKDIKRAEELKTLWDKWNESNIPCSMMGYLQYHEKLKEFYKSTIPEAARDKVLKE
ncbi:MAG: sulfatase-like hydrolase/transferase [Rikenellaceae bacterium]